MEMKIKSFEVRGVKISFKKKGKEIGRCFVYAIENDIHKNPYALLEDVLVVEELRGEGIGSELVKKAVEVAKEMKCYKIIATSRFERDKIHGWYEKLGFKKFGYEFRMDLES